MKKVFRVIFFLFVGLFFMIHFFSSLKEVETPATEFAGDDFDVADTLQSEVIITHNRVWKDADESTRALQFSVSSLDEGTSFDFRNDLEVEYDGIEKNFWRNLYYELYSHDRMLMAPFQDSIRALAGVNGIQIRDLVYTIVTLVQDIPYNYILSNDSCAWHMESPCVSMQRYGILSPVEFLYSLSGDCDTRTVLLFTILKNLGYEPIIVNSSQYHHSMLAVDVPTEGDYFIHKGRKFYFWETTATGWLPGMLPPEMNNTDYWTIILDYELQADPSRDY